jgi:chloramphenicol 3-O phosphotransferase
VSQTEVYAHGDRDLVVDTTRRTAEDCAREIVDRLEALAAPKAFTRLRNARAQRGTD